MKIFNGTQIRRMAFLLAGPAALIFLAACNTMAPLSAADAAETPTASASVPGPHPHREIPFALIEKLAVDMSRWHFNSTEDIGGILADAQALGVVLTAGDLNQILDEDERKRLWRVGAAEYHIGALYGEEAQVVFKVRHYVSLAGLWSELALAEKGPTAQKGYLMVAAGNIGLAARAVRELPANWDCWAVTGCEPRPPMRPVTFQLDAALASEGNDLYLVLMELSRSAVPHTDDFSQFIRQAADWDVRVCGTLKGLS